MIKKMTTILSLLIFSVFIMTAVFIVRLGVLPPQIPLFYSRLEGDAQITDTWMIFLLPTLLSVLIGTNHFVTRKYFKENHFVQTLTYYFNISIIVIVTFIFTRIIFLVT